MQGLSALWGGRLRWVWGRRRGPSQPEPAAEPAAARAAAPAPGASTSGRAPPLRSSAGSSADAGAQADESAMAATPCNFPGMHSIPRARAAPPFQVCLTICVSMLQRFVLTTSQALLTSSALQPRQPLSCCLIVIFETDRGRIVEHNDEYAGTCGLEGDHSCG